MILCGSSSLKYLNVNKINNNINGLKNRFFLKKLYFIISSEGMGYSYLATDMRNDFKP